MSDSKIPDAKLPDSPKGWAVVIAATIASLIAEYLIISAAKRWWS